MVQAHQAAPRCEPQQIHATAAEKPGQEFTTIAETGHQEPTIPAAEGQQNNERTFTQAEMNAIISDRLSRERSKYADYDDLKAKAQQFDAAQEAGKTELQKANEKAVKLQAQLDSMTRANTLRDIRGKVAAATGVPAELLSGDTEEACTAQAQAILKFAQPGYPRVRDGGEVRNKPTGSTRQQFADWFAQVTK